MKYTNNSDTEALKIRIEELEEEIVSTVCSEGLSYPDHVISRDKFETIAKKYGY